MGQDGEPWFVAKDVCDILGTATRDVPDILDGDEHKPLMGVCTSVDSIHSVREYGGLRKDSRLVSEAGIYGLILVSRKVEARAFKRWLKHEVLPAIRKTGGYIHATPEMSDQEILARAVLIGEATLCTFLLTT